MGVTETEAETEGLDAHVEVDTESEGTDAEAGEDGEVSVGEDCDREIKLLDLKVTCRIGTKAKKKQDLY